MITGGITLDLSADSTFLLLTCANKFTGTYTVQGDSLYLNCETNVWRNDSLQEFGYEGTWPEVPTKPMRFLVVGDELRSSRRNIERNKVIHRNLVKKPEL